MDELEQLKQENEALRGLIKDLFADIKANSNLQGDFFLYGPEYAQRQAEHYRELTIRVFDTLYPDLSDEEKEKLSIEVR